MPSHLSRLAAAVASLGLAALACARADLPILAATPVFASPVPPRATATQAVTTTAATAPAATATATPPAGEALATSAATAEATGTLEASPTPRVPATVEVRPTTVGVFVLIPNGTFDTGLERWGTPSDALAWEAGYARVNAAEGASLAQPSLQVPREPNVLLSFGYRTEAADAGACEIEIGTGEVLTVLGDGEWHTAEVDYSAQAGASTTVSLAPIDAAGCEWLNFDNIAWRVPQAAGTETPAGTPTPPPVPTLAAIPPEATFTRQLTVTAEGDLPVGNPRDIADGRAITWASLRNGKGVWVADLGEALSVTGLRVTFHRDGNFDTLLLGIDVSANGQVWQPAYEPEGSCLDVPSCEAVAQATAVEFPFGPVEARYVRLLSGPSRFAIAELEIALAP